MQGFQTGLRRGMFLEANERATTTSIGGSQGNGFPSVVVTMEQKFFSSVVGKGSLRRADVQSSIPVHSVATQRAPSYPKHLVGGDRLPLYREVPFLTIMANKNLRRGWQNLTKRKAHPDHHFHVTKWPNQMSLRRPIYPSCSNWTSDIYCPWMWKFYLPLGAECLRWASPPPFQAIQANGYHQPDMAANATRRGKLSLSQRKVTMPSMCPTDLLPALRSLHSESQPKG